MMPIRDVVQVNPEILGGQAVFKGTSISIETIFNYPGSESLELFLSEFPSLSREQALSVLGIASKMVSHSNFIQFYGAAA
jgi:uncharacterized protein (DUF433 family)